MVKAKSRLHPGGFKAFDHLTLKPRVPSKVRLKLLPPPSKCKKAEVSHLLIKTPLRVCFEGSASDLLHATEYCYLFNERFIIKCAIANDIFSSEACGKRDDGDHQCKNNVTGIFS